MSPFTEVGPDEGIIDLLLPWLDYGDARLRSATLERMAAAGYAYVSLTLALDGASLQDATLAIGRERAMLRNSEGRYRLATRVAEIRQARKDGCLAVGFNFQGTEAVGRNLDLVDAFAALGVRQMLLCYNQANAVGAGCHELNDGGLTRFGRALVERMNRVGVLVDLSHTGHRTARDAMEVSAKPVVFSHSNPLELFAHGRNIPAELARACAATGGVIGINGCGMFMTDNDTSAEGLFRLVDAHVQSVGPAHVGIGLDWLYDLPAWLTIVQEPENALRYPDDGDYRRMDVRFAPPEEVPHLAARLRAAGYAEVDVRAILGGNWLRVLEEVWT
jgi:membrane dipeptidase